MAMKSIDKNARMTKDYSKAISNEIMNLSNGSRKSSSSRIRYDPKNGIVSDSDDDKNSVDSFLEDLANESHEDLLKKWKQENSAKLATFKSALSGEDDDYETHSDNDKPKRKKSVSRARISRERSHSETGSESESSTSAIIRRSRVRSRSANSKRSRSLNSRTSKSTNKSKTEKNKPKPSSLKVESRKNIKTAKAPLRPKSTIPTSRTANALNTKARDKEVALIRSQIEKAYTQKENKLLDENRTLKNKVRVAMQREKQQQLQYQELTNKYRTLELTSQEQIRIIAELKRKLATLKRLQNFSRPTAREKQLEEENKELKELNEALGSKLAKEQARRKSFQRKLDRVEIIEAKKDMKTAEASDNESIAEPPPPPPKPAPAQQKREVSSARTSSPTKTTSPPRQPPIQSQQPIPSSPTRPKTVDVALSPRSYHHSNEKHDNLWEKPIAPILPRTEEFSVFSDYSSSQQARVSAYPSDLNMSSISESSRNQNALDRYKKLKAMYTEKFLS